MKKNDIILIAVILVVTAAVLLGVRIWQKGNTGDSAQVVVTIDGQQYGSYPLNEDRTERIELPDGSYNILVISEGYANVSEASCPDQICVKHNHVRFKGETIVCLPNKVVVEIIGGENNGIDGSTF